MLETTGGTVEDPFTHGPCVACGSAYKILLRHVGTVRTKRVVPLLYCLDCETMTCISDYAENDAQRMADLTFTLPHANMKLREFGRLATFLKERLPGVADHADVGCDFGALVKAFGDTGFRSTGYDINRYAIEHGRQLFPRISLVANGIGSDGKAYGLLTAIDVLEHMKDPASLFLPMMSAIQDGGFLYVVVPRVDRDCWKHLREPIADQIKQRTEWSPFVDNDVHIVHYSSRGLTEVGRRFGLEVVADFSANPWPLNGILYRKPGASRLAERSRWFWPRRHRHTA